MWSRTNWDDVVEGGVVAEFEVVVAGDVPGFADGGEDFGLLDGVDAQVGFEVEVGVQEVGGVAGLLGDDGQDAVEDRVAARGGGGRSLGRCGSRCGGGGRRGRRGSRGRRRRGRGRGDGPRGSGPAVDDAQAMLDDLELRHVLPADAGQPRVPRGAVVDPIVEAQLLGIAAPPVRDRRPAQQQHRDLGAEARGQAQREPHGIRAALGQVELPERRVDVAEVRDRRDDPRLQRLHGDDVLDPDAHRVPGEALGVGDHDAVGALAEDLAQCVDLRRRAAAPGGGVGLVRDEEELGGERVAGDAAGALAGRHEPLHDLADVLDVQARAVEGAVRGDRAQHLADRRDPTLARGVRALHDERGGAHAEEHAVAAHVERQRGVLHRLVRRGRPRREEPGADPREHLVGGRVVGGDHDDPPAAARADPVLGDRHRLRRAGARGVELRVGPARADQLGELRMAHREDAEEEAAVELVGVLLELEPHVVDAALDLRPRDLVALGHPGENLLELRELLPAAAVGPEPVELVGELVVAREGGPEHDARVVPQRLGQRPAVGQLRTGRRVAVVLDERDAGVAQGVDARGDGELGRAPERGDAPGVHTELGLQIERPRARGELDDVRDVVDLDEVRLAVVALHQPRDVPVGDGVADRLRDDVDALCAVEDRGEVVLVEEPVGAGQAEAGAGDDDGLVPLREGRAVVPEQRAAALQRVREQPPQLQQRGVGRVLGRRRCGARGDGGSGRRGGRGRLRGGADAAAGGVEAAQRDVERRKVASLRVVRVEVQGVVVAEHVAREPLQRALGARLDEDARAPLPEGVQAGDELHGRGDLAAEEVDDPVHRVRSGRVEPAVDVRDDRDARRRDLQAAQRRAQRLAGRGDDLGVECVADGQRHRLVPECLQPLDDLVHRGGGAAEDDLLGGVDVRQRRRTRRPAR